MAKRKRATTDSTIVRRLKEGRGMGHGKDYKPWLNIQDVPSTGQLNRITSHTVGREHQLMSELELKYLWVFDWLAQIIDIREQYPLLPQEDTINIAEALGIEHPRDPKTKDLIVVTTDFAITIDGPNGPKDRGIAVKMASDLQDRRVIEKLEIERLYWTAAGVSWCVATDRDLDPVFVENLKLLHNYRGLNDSELSPNHIEDIAAELNTRVRRPMALSKIAMDIDRELGLKRGTSLGIAYHLMATRRWNVDMRTAINPSKPVQFVAPPSETGDMPQ